VSVNHLLPCHLFLVERCEVVDNDRYWQRNDQHPAHTARRAHQLPPASPRVLIAVPDRRHRDRRPPERVRDAGKVRVRNVFLGEVDETGEDEDLDGEEHHEQSELLVAALESVSERLESGGMACQFEDAQDAEDSQQLDQARDVLELVAGV